MVRLWRGGLCGLACALSAVLASPAGAQECRVAFDLGSSGVRASASGVGAPVGTPSRDIDMLAPLTAGLHLDPLVPALASALSELPVQAGWPEHCQRMGGGFSAWRLAWQQDAPRLIDQLEDLRRQTGVAVLVLPSLVEGRYGHASAQQVLGAGLKTSHILDLGGGSLQVAGERQAFGIELGQKSWQRMLCKALGRAGEVPCHVQPLTAAELQQARSLLDLQLTGLRAEAGPGELTAISRPVTRGIRWALRALGFQATDAIATQDLSQAIDRLAGLELAPSAQLTASAAPFAGFLLSDMLLVEGVLRATGNSRLALAEASINNLSALLADERAFAWARQYPCYLQRLRETGPAAYFSEPSGCGKP